MGKVYLVRHGQSEANKNRIWGGNLPLTDAGKEQARSIRSKLPEEPDFIATSMLIRVKQTAEEVYPGKPKEANRVFNEIQVGDLDMVPMTSETLAFYHNDIEGFLKSVNGDDLESRTKEAIDEIKRYASMYDTVVIFSSNTLIRSIVTKVLNKTFAETTEYYIRNCEVITFDYDNELTADDVSAMIKIEVMK